jgi:hypothetical protein
MIYELDNSNKVKPFFRKDIPLIKRDPLLAYKLGFYFMFIVNILILLS